LTVETVETYDIMEWLLYLENRIINRI